MYICGYKHDWAPAASNKDTVAMGFVRGTAMVTFIYMVAEKKWFGLGLAASVPDNETVKNSGPARLGSDRVGLDTERVGNSGDPLHQIKIPWQWVSCAEQRWWTFIYMVAEKNGLG